MLRAILGAILGILRRILCATHIPHVHTDYFPISRGACSGWVVVDVTYLGVACGDAVLRAHSRLVLMHGRVPMRLWGRSEVEVSTASCLRVLAYCAAID